MLQTYLLDFHKAYAISTQLYFLGAVLLLPSPSSISFNGRAIFQEKRAEHGHLREPATGLTPGNWKDGSDEALATLITEE
jgi:hypothetical protein